MSDERSITIDEVIRQAEIGRQRILAAGLKPSDPWARLRRKEALGIDVSAEVEALKMREKA